MQDIFNWLSNEDGYTINDIITSDNEPMKLTHIYFSNVPHNCVGCVTAPHNGNDFHFLLRVNDFYTFDRWTNADYEKTLLTANEVIILLMENDPWL